MAASEMCTVARCLFALFMSLTLIACSATVPSEKVYGTYVASYPFGTETLTLNRDGTFVQQVHMKNEQPVTARGSWTFYPKAKSRVDLDGFMAVLDEFDHLRSDWQKVAPGFASMDVETRSFRIVIGSAGKFPYVKQ